MLRASQAVRVGVKCVSSASMLHPPHTRLISVQLVRDKSKKRKSATPKKKPLPEKWGARMADDDYKSILAPSKRARSKFGKLADKLAQIKAAKAQEELSSDPEERAQKALLNSIQGPLMSPEDFKTKHHDFLKPVRPVARVDPESKSYVERTYFDSLSGRHVAKSSLDNLYKLDSAQKGTKTALVFDKRGAVLVRKVNEFMESRDKRRPRLQQINMRVRIKALQHRLQLMVEDEVQFQIEQQKIYLAKLETIQSRAEGEDVLSEEDITLLESLKAEYASQDTPLSSVLVQLGDYMAKYDFQYLKSDLVRLILSNDSDTINILDPKDDWSLKQLKIAKFVSRNQGMFIPTATVCDGSRLYARCAQDIVIVPFTKVSDRQLSVLYKNALSAEFERIKKEYDLSEDEAIGQLQAIFDSGDNYLAHFPVLPKEKQVVEEQDEFDFFQLEEASKDYYYKYDKLAPAEIELPDEAESIKHSLRSQESTFDQVVSYLNMLKPPTDVVYTQRWTALAEKIEKSVLVDDLRKYIRESFKKNKIPFPQRRLLQHDLIEMLRTQVWKLTLTDSIKQLNFSTATFTLSDTEKLLLFKYHFELVRLWASRGADVSFSGEHELEVKGSNQSQHLVSVTLAQFKERVTRARLDLSASDVDKMTPELWKTLETTTETQMDYSDSDDIQVSYLGNADKAVSLLKRYIDSMKPHSRFSQSIMYQTNPESVQKSAFYPRSVSHEQPWYKRATKSWSRWREIHGSEFVINTEQPVLSLVTSKGVKKLATDLPLQNLISETLQKQLATLPATTITQDEEHCVVAETRDEKTVRQANALGVSAPYDPSANNEESDYEKVAIEAVLGHLVHANKSTGDAKGSLDVANINPVSDVHFSGSVPFVNEKLQSMFPKSRHAAQDRFRVVLSCIPVSGNAPPISIEAVTLQKNESWLQYAPPSVYAITRQANLLVSLPSTNSDIMFVAKARHKLHPSADMLETWKKFSQDFKRKVDHPPQFELNVNGKNVTYKCVSVVYTRHDEYPIVNYQEASSGVILHRNTLGGDLSGVRNEVSMGMVYRDYEEGRELEEGEEEHPQDTSDKLLYEFVGNSLKFMDSLDAESVPL